MSTYSEIQQKILNLKPDFITETVSLNNSFNRILQQDILADMDMPPYDKSSMDGYACRLQDIENELEMLEIIQAGKLSTYKIGKNQCSKIMTGAAVPENADCVFKIEESTTLSSGKIRCLKLNTKKNICYKAEDYALNQILIKKGSIIQSPQIAVLAGAGYSNVEVSLPPKIALISTGSELVEPHIKPPKGMIRNSNSSQINSQLQRMNLSAKYVGLFGDDFNKLSSIFQQVSENYDYIIFTGGASNGDFDFIPKILESHDFEIFWQTTGIKPGNPMTFAKKGNKYCFGLSGNPVSSMVQFEFLVKPIIYKLLGASYNAFRVKATLEPHYKRSINGRFGVEPVIINSKGLVEIIPFHGSANINALIYANAFMEVPEDISEFKNGDQVYVRPI